MAKREPGGSIGTGWMITWPLLPVFAAMVFMTAQELTRPRHPGSSVGISRQGWHANLAGRIDALTRALESLPLDLGSPLKRITGAGQVAHVHRRYTVVMDLSQAEPFRLAVEALRGTDRGVTVTSDPVTPVGFEIRIGLDGLLTHTIVVRTALAERGPARVAVVADGLGRDLRIASEFASLEVPVALAITPGQPFSQEVAKLGLLMDRDVLADLSVGTGDNVDAAVHLDDRLSDDLDAVLRGIPNAVGAVAVPDAELRRTRRRLAVLGTELERRRLFLLDGARPTAPDRARVVRVKGKSGSSVESLTTQLAQVTDDVPPGGVVVLVSGTADLVRALRAVLPLWHEKGAQVVRLSDLMGAAPSGAPRRQAASR